MGDALPAVSLGTGRTAAAIATGSSHACALLDDGSVKCWGANSLGQLGQGDTAIRGDQPGEMGDALPAVRLGTGRTAVAIRAGGSFNCALLDDASVKCWGYGYFAQLGLGDSANRGDAAGEMGDALPAVDLGSGRSVTGLTAGGFHSCALLDNGALKCWGMNSSGQLGLGDLVTRGNDPGEMGDALPTVNVGTGRSVVAAEGGYTHTCVLLNGGDLKCWGWNTYGQLGLGDFDSRGGQSWQMGDNLPMIDLGSP
jgi:alpha-tubulin suppressor-like RCC1 family protein